MFIAVVVLRCSVAWVRCFYRSNSASVEVQQTLRHLPLHRHLLVHSSSYAHMSYVGTITCAITGTSITLLLSVLTDATEATLTSVQWRCDCVHACIRIVAATSHRCLHLSPIFSCDIYSIVMNIALHSSTRLLLLHQPILVVRSVHVAHSPLLLRTNVTAAYSTSPTLHYVDGG